jgi:hypothetical protein
MKRKGAAQKKDEQTKTKRTEIQKQIATSRAPHFARAEKLKPTISSTPTGVFTQLQKSSTQGKITLMHLFIKRHILSPLPFLEESWPGPFSLAHEMISKREEAKLLREQRLLEKDQEDTLEDDYDQFLSHLNHTHLEELYQANQNTVKGKNLQIPSLTNLCIELLAKHFDDVESTGTLSVETKTELAIQLSKLRKLTCSNLLFLLNGTREQLLSDDEMRIEELMGMSCLILHDCSSIDEETMIKAICNANGVFGKYLSSPEPTSLTMRPEDQPTLKTLILKNCGHSFTAWMTSRLNHYHVLRNLEYLTLAGLYRLSDQAISDFFTNLSHSASSPSSSSLSFSSGRVRNYLRSLDLSYCSSLNTLGLTSILNTSPHLTTLVVDYTPLDRSALLILCARQYDLPHLTELSVSGVIALTDPILAFLLSGDTSHAKDDPTLQGEEIPSCPQQTSSSMKPFGQRLRILCVKECHLLSDACFISIRTFCSELMNLNLSSIKSFNSPVSLLGLFISHQRTSEDLSTEISSPSSPSSLIPFHVPPSIGSNLRHLSLSGLADCVTDEVIIEACRLSNSFNSSHHGLVSLDISGCSQLTNRTLIGIKHHCHLTLQYLDISFVRSFTTEVLFTLVFSCHSLGKLSVWGCTQLKSPEKKSGGASSTINKIANRSLMDLIESKAGLEVTG